MAFVGGYQAVKVILLEVCLSVLWTDHRKKQYEIFSQVVNLPLKNGHLDPLREVLRTSYNSSLPGILVGVYSILMLLLVKEKKVDNFAVVIFSLPVDISLFIHPLSLICIFITTFYQYLA